MHIIYAIHQFYPDSFSGTERFLLQLASSIRRSGHHPRVLTYSLGDIQAARMVGELLVKEYDYHGIAVTAAVAASPRVVLAGDPERAAAAPQDRPDYNRDVGQVG